MYLSRETLQNVWRNLRKGQEEVIKFFSKSTKWFECMTKMFTGTEYIFYSKRWRGGLDTCSTLIEWCPISEEELSLGAKERGLSSWGWWLLWFSLLLLLDTLAVAEDPAVADKGWRSTIAWISWAVYPKRPCRSHTKRYTYL